MTTEPVTNRHKELIFPLTWSTMEREDENSMFYNVEFTDDFGDIKKGECFEYVSIYFDVGMLTAYPTLENEGPHPRIRVYFKCVPSQGG